MCVLCRITLHVFKRYGIRIRLTPPSPSEGDAVRPRTSPSSFASTCEVYQTSQPHSPTTPFLVPAVSIRRPLAPTQNTSIRPTGNTPPSPKLLLIALEAYPVVEQVNSPDYDMPFRFDRVGGVADI